jgi:hypothetical protein
MTLQEKDLYGDESRTEKVFNKEAVLKRKLPVRFSLESNQVFPIIHINDMDESAIYNTWYTKKECIAIKKEIVSVVRLMLRGIRIEENNKKTVRGLEFRTREGCLHRKQNKLAAKNAVMAEQRRQVEEGDRDEKRLAEAYSCVSFHCQKAASALAWRDEMEIKRELEKMRWRFSLVPEVKIPIPCFKDQCRVMQALAA